MRYVWDPKKAASNVRKHGGGFEEASTVFDDDRALVQPDVAHDDRLLILGTSSRARVLFVVYVEFETADVVRIISARKATRHEQAAYENE